MFLIAASTKGLEELKASDSTQGNDDDEHCKNHFPCIFFPFFVSNVS